MFKMIKNNLIKTIGISILSVVSCYATDKNKKDSINVDSYNIDVTKLDSDDWNCFDNKSHQICIPIQWENQIVENSVCFSPLNDNDDNTFFVILMHDTNNVHLNLKGYLQELYHQLIIDTNEIFTEYTLKELNFDNKNAYYGEFLTEYNNNQYFTYAMYTIKNGFLFDFSLKIKNKDKTTFYKIFQNILYNFKTDSNYLFSEKDEL